jgi:hypothetical protein
MSFWDEIRELRRHGKIPRQWRIADIRPFLLDRYAENAIRTIPPNQSITPDGDIKATTSFAGIDRPWPIE